FLEAGVSFVELESSDADYPNAAALTWEQPSESNSTQLDLGDGSRIEFFAEGRRLRCLERSGELRWSASEPEPVAGREPTDLPTRLGEGCKVLLADETLVFVVQY